MILYNIRHRGPFEYDKFVLNILQVSNETKRLLKNFNAAADSKIPKKQKAIDELLASLSGEKGVLQNIMSMQEQIT
jgi:hypothetical protein